MIYRSFFIAIIVLSLLGMSNSFYSLTNSDSLGGVSDSEYSAIIGVPVEGFGLVGYALVALLAYFLLKEKRYSLVKEENLFYLAGFGLLYSLYVNSVEIFILHAFCLMCLVSFIFILTISILAYLIIK